MNCSKKKHYNLLKLIWLDYWVLNYNVISVIMGIYNYELSYLLMNSHEKPIISWIFLPIKMVMTPKIRTFFSIIWDSSSYRKYMSDLKKKRKKRKHMSYLTFRRSTLPIRVISKIELGFHEASKIRETIKRLNLVISKLSWKFKNSWNKIK